MISGSAEKVWTREANLLYTCHMAAIALPEQFRSSKSFIFPKRKFGARGEERSFRAEWCQSIVMTVVHRFVCLIAISNFNHKIHQNQSQNTYFSKIFWDGMPPDSPSCSMLCMFGCVLCTQMSVYSKLFLLTISASHMYFT